MNKFYFSSVNDEQANTLLEKKKQLRLKLAVRDVIHNELEGWLPVADYFLCQKIPYRLLRLACIKAEELPYWETELKSGKLAPYEFRFEDLLISDEDPIRKNVLQAFPNTNPFRYVPKLPLKSVNSSNWKAELERAAKDLDMMGTEVIFFYWRYSPILSVNMDVILNMDEDPVGIMPEDMVICTHDYSRMICRTMEEDWYWGEGISKI